MTSSFMNENESIYSRTGDDIDSSLQVLANRYISANPKYSFVYRTFNRGGFVRNADYRYEFDLNQKFDNLEIGQYVYCWSKLWVERESELAFSISCFGPVQLWVNNEIVYKSNISDEVFPNRKKGFRVKLKAGQNDFYLEFLKTQSGCGGRFGTGSMKNFPLHFLAPTLERKNQEGWIYSKPLDKPMSDLPMGQIKESELATRWYPRVQWSDTERKQGRFSRLFGNEVGSFAYAWSQLSNLSFEKKEVILTGSHEGTAALYLNGKEVYRSENSSTVQLPIVLDYGQNNVVVCSGCTSNHSWGFHLELDSLDEYAQVHWKLPCPVLGEKGKWLFLGTFEKPSEQSLQQICRMDKFFDDGDNGTYWRVDQPNTWVRPYLENPLFGKWNYPLGVTLYGLLETGLELNREDYTEYVLDHIEMSTSFDQYALWDRSRYGAAGINNQISAIDSLDDCGSFGSITLLAMRQRQIKDARLIVDRIAEYISHQQDRRADGTLYRKRGSADFMQDTIWCDDLYMSVPFLIRYYQLTQDTAYLDDAAAQFLLYKKYLYMPELRIMSHVYDFKTGQQTGVPWGRGNGWVLFSLSELLTVLPEDYRQYEELMQFYLDLSAGYVRLQGTNGLWHQVLTLPDSYEESSCTSMFIYAFARGIRQEWFPKPASYLQAVAKGWEGLMKRAVDKHGNLYGVCRGSGYSYSPLYYKDDLSWILNDTHGIGIVMLAGIEYRRMQQDLNVR